MQPGVATTTFANKVEDLELSKYYLQSDFNKIYKQLTGQHYIKGKGLMQVARPMLTSEGAKRVQMFLETYADKNFRMNKYDEEEIQKTGKVFNRNFAGWFINNLEDFEVREDEVRLIIGLVSDFVVGCLKKSQDEGERQFQRGTVQTREVITNKSNQSGLLTSLFRGK